MEIVQQQYQTGYSSLRSNMPVSAQFASQSNVSVNSLQTSSQSLSSNTQSWPPTNEQITQNDEQAWSSKTWPPPQSSNQASSRQDESVIYNSNGETTSLLVEKNQLFIIYKSPDGKVVEKFPPTDFSKQFNFDSNLLGNALSLVNVFA